MNISERLEKRAKDYGVGSQTALLFRQAAEYIHRLEKENEALRDEVLRSLPRVKEVQND